MAIDLSTLSALSGKLVTEYKDETSVIQIRESSGFRWLYTGGEAIQSIIEIKDPQKLLLPVPKALLVALLWLPQKARVLNLGVGGGTIENALASINTVQITSIEANPQIIAFAKQYFNFPKKLKIIERCAFKFLLEERQYYDLISVDLFNEELMPHFCSSKDFYRTLAIRLSSKGVAAINLYPKNEEELLNILLLNKSLFSNIALIKFDKYKNIVLLLSNHTFPDMQTLTIANQKFLNVNFKDIINNIIYVVNL